MVLCTNTMHKIFPAIEAVVQIPLLHIADATAQAIKEQGIESVGLLGTKFTMEQDFYAGRLAEKHGLKVLIPDQEERDIVHDVIYGELVKGKVSQDSRIQYQQIIKNLKVRGAQGVIAGCTEIGILIQQEHSSLPLFDTALIHARSAVRFALE